MFLGQCSLIKTSCQNTIINDCIMSKTVKYCSGIVCESDFLHLFGEFIYSIMNIDACKGRFINDVKNKNLNVKFKLDNVFC